MPLRTIKKDTDKALSLEWVLHVKNYKLSLDKETCVGCQICSLACPKEAIKVEKTPKNPGEKARKAKIDLDIKKCNFCGICDILCPYGAVELTVDGQHLLSVVEKESFPSLTRNIQVDARKFPTDRSKSEGVCPLGLIKISFSTPDGKPIESPNTLIEPERSWFKTDVSVDKDHCPCCTICETKLPNGAMRVRKFLSGKIAVNPSKCPDGCKDCLDVCPITGALYLSSEDNKVHSNDAFCVYCGACRIVCPVDGALELKRTRVNHSPVRSGAWNMALERLTSPTDMTKELKTKGSRRAREAVERRMRIEETVHA